MHKSSYLIASAISSCLAFSVTDDVLDLHSTRFWVRPSEKVRCRTSENVNSTDDYVFLEEHFSFPIMVKEHRSNATALRYLYVADNGIAVFTASPLPLGAALALQNPTHMLRFAFLNDFKVIVAPLWMRSGLSEAESSSVCVESFLMPSQSTSVDITSVDEAIKAEFSVGFKSLSLTIATWRNIVPRWKNPNEKLNITGERLSFQLIIATDFLSTYLVTSYGEMITLSRNSIAEYTHALGPAVFKGKIEKSDVFVPEGQ